MVNPAASSMRASRSTNRHASWRANRVPTVVLPEPIKPARHKICTRARGPRKGGGCVTFVSREKLIALQNADCTTVGGKFDLGETHAHRAEKALGKFRGHMFYAVGIGLQIFRGLIIHRAGGRLRGQIERIVTLEAYFHQTFPAAHAIHPGVYEIA